MTKLASLWADCSAAVERLEEVLALSKDAVVRDSAIPRFEISFGLFWKTLKACLEEEHNTVCASLRARFKVAFKNGVISDDPSWIDLTKLRNDTVRAYNEELAEYVYARLSDATLRYREVVWVTAS